MPARTRPARMRRLLAAGIVAGTIAAALAAAPATAQPIDGGPISDGFSETIEDFCDVEGLTIEHDASLEGRFMVNARKPGTAPFFLLTASAENVYRNADGVEVTEALRIVEKDLEITDNGDGTLTILVLVTGNATVTGPDGKAIARNPGQVRYEILIDHGGTVADPSDDVFLEFLGLVKGSTGRSDDFCEAVVPVLG